MAWNVAGARTLWHSANRAERRTWQRELSETGHCSSGTGWHVCPGCCTVHSWMSLFQSVVTVPSRSMKSLAPFSSQIPRTTKRDSSAKHLALLHPQGWSDPHHWMLETGFSNISANLHTSRKHGWVYSTEEEWSKHLLTTETVHLRSKGLGAKLQLEFIVLWSECEDVAKMVEPDFIHDRTVDADFHVSAHVRGRDQSPIHCHLLQQEKGHQ